jgi:hypothetical protein
MLLYGFNYTTCDFATNKMEKNMKYHKPSKKTLNCQNYWQISAFLLNGDTKITDWITSQTPICRRHPINLNNNIKDISQKKIYKKRYWYSYLSLIVVIQTMKVEVANSKMQHCSTLDAPNTFEWHPKLFSIGHNTTTAKNSHSRVNHVFLKGRNTKCFRVKLIKQRSSRRKSAPLMSVKPSHSFPDLSSLKLLNMNGRNNMFKQKSQHQNATFSCI